MKLIYIILFFLTTQLCVGQGILKVERDTINLGTIYVKVDTNGRPIDPKTIDVSFKIKNVGNDMVVIKNCPGSGKGICKFQIEPIKPNQQSKVDIKFFIPNHDGAYKLEFPLIWHSTEERITKLYIQYYRKTIKSN